MRLPGRPLLALSTGLLLAPASGHAWLALLPDTPDNGRPFAIAADGAGDVLAAGRVLDPNGDDDGVLAKLAGADGALRWQQRFDGTAPPGSGGENLAAETLRALALAPEGDALAAGMTVNTGSGVDMLVVRRAAADGAVVWDLAVDGGASLRDEAQAIALHDGDVFVAGALTPAAATASRPALLKLGAANGTEAWRMLLAGDGGIARALAIDSAGGAFVAGDVGAEWFVAKHAAGDGAEIWRTDVAGEPGEAVVRGLALRPGGAPVAAGRLFHADTGSDFVVSALSASGTVDWMYTADGSATGSADADDAFAVAVDAAGDVVAAGVLSNADTDDDLYVVKLDGATGAVLWSATVNGSNNNDDDAAAAAIDSSGDVVVTGGIRNQGSGRDLAVLAFDGATGAERWRRLVNGATSQADVGFALALDADGAALAAGRTRNGAAADGFTVLKLAGTTGGDFPCGTGTIEADEACDDGNLATGDGCRPDCTVEACGDGILDPQETCDDGNTADGDCCSALCATDSDGTACADDDACTHGQSCLAGVCQGGTETVCLPSNDCHTAACDPATGLCGEQPLPNGRLCDDGDACTVADRCLAGTCTPGGIRSCNDFDPCTTDACVPATGCTFDPFTGFAGVSCAFDQTRIDTFCFAGLPRSIERRIERAQARVAKAEAARKTGRARRLLKSARNLAETARRRAAKKTAAGDLQPACGAALDDVLVEVGQRALALRDELGAAP